MKKLLYSISIAALICSCSNLGTFSGDYNKVIAIPSGMRLLDIKLTKDSSLLLYMETADSSYVPKMKTLQKTSKYGIVERRIVFMESKGK